MVSYIRQVRCCMRISYFNSSSSTTITMYKSLIIYGLVALALSASAGYIEHHEEEHYAPPHYSFEYKVHDSHTGDIKSQHETREGDVVKGFYMLKEADGTIREVHYTADKHNGFNAEVKKIGHAVHQQPIHHHQY